MTFRRIRFRVGAEQADRRLDDLLAGRLASELAAPPGRAALRRLIMAGAVSVNGQPLRAPGRTLPAGTQVAAEVDLARLSPPRRPAAPLSAPAVLFEDDLLLAVDKPPGLAMHPTADKSRTNLVDLVKALLRARGTGDEPYLAVHQRLDRDTSGVVLFGKHPDANAGLAAAFASRGVRKTYEALTRRPKRLPPRTWAAAEPLGPIGRGRMGPAPDGQPAETRFTLLEDLGRALHLEAQPRTGRKHQIRAHLAAAGLPILGDTVYGGQERDAPRVMLHARRLELPHPGTGAPLRIESALPADFRALVARLRGARRPR